MSLTVIHFSDIYIKTADDAILKRVRELKTASPIFILGALQNIDAVQQQFGGSKFGYLYETLIISSLLKISGNYSSAGNYDVDIGILSNLAYKMLQEKRTGFTTEQIEK